ncbi:MAG: S-ribosylhomocysteine lyase [Clostridia bacterium]|nr:S-ribosylhomocysteine lyase [Clostridia bacterium]
MNENGKELVESFTLDHTRVVAPFIRLCTVYKGEKGDTVAKYDIRFKQPNEGELESAGIHTLEHLMATYMRNYMEGIIDLSPMGCRTGFYLTVWGEPEISAVTEAVTKSLTDVVCAEEVPAVNPIQCGNYRLHSLELAKEYAREVLANGFNENYMI